MAKAANLLINWVDWRLLFCGDPAKFCVKPNKALPIRQDLMQEKTERKCFYYGKNIKGVMTTASSGGLILAL